MVTCKYHQNWGVGIIGKCYPLTGSWIGQDYEFSFPYLYDESQQVAIAYQAACTPDFFLFNAEHRLIYRGQYDDARPGNNEVVNGADLQAASRALLSNKSISEQQIPSMGCNIKWRAENEPAY